MISSQALETARFLDMKNIAVCEDCERLLKWRRHAAKLELSVTPII